VSSAAIQCLRRLTDEGNAPAEHEVSGKQHFLGREQDNQVLGRVGGADGSQQQPHAPDHHFARTVDPLVRGHQPGVGIDPRREFHP
jgi:hypothetical protein